MGSPSAMDEHSSSVPTYKAIFRASTVNPVVEDDIGPSRPVSDSRPRGITVISLISGIEKVRLAEPASP